MLGRTTCAVRGAGDEVETLIVAIAVGRARDCGWHPSSKVVEWQAAISTGSGLRQRDSGSCGGVRIYVAGGRQG
jgi:hypothetical protein